MNDDHHLMDHEDGDTDCSLDPRHGPALRLRRSGAPPWGRIETSKDGGGWRDFLDGDPIHCGSGLELQAREYRSDDYGEFTLALPTGVRVRYEVAWLRERPAEGPPWRAVLYHSAGGHTFTTPLEPWMRFRWPKREGR